MFNQYPRLVTALNVAAFAVGLSAFYFRGKADPEPPVIPAAAAMEANLVCASFEGLTTFEVHPLSPSSAAEGTYTRYKVVATCKSKHTVHGVIELLTDPAIPPKETT